MKDSFHYLLCDNKTSPVDIFLRYLIINQSFVYSDCYAGSYIVTVVYGHNLTLQQISPDVVIIPHNSDYLFETHAV